MLRTNMEGSRKKTGGCVLAGGLATRANGADKGKFIVGEKSFFERILLTFKELEECFVSYNKQGSNISEELNSTNLFRRECGLPDIRIIADLDEVAGRGPISGLYSVLQASSCEGIIFCPCDVPYFNVEIVNILVREFDGDVPVIMKSGGCIQSLCGIYPKKILPVIEKCIKDGEYSIQRVLNAVDTRYLDAEDYGFDAKTFCNINTLEALRELQNADIVDE